MRIWDDPSGVHAAWNGHHTCVGIDDVGIVRDLWQGDLAQVAGPLRKLLQPVRDAVREAAGDRRLAVLAIERSGDVELHDQMWELAFSDLDGFGNTIEVVRTNGDDTAAVAATVLDRATVFAASPTRKKNGYEAFNAWTHAQHLRLALPVAAAVDVSGGEFADHARFLVFAGHTDNQGSVRSVLRFPWNGEHSHPVSGRDLFRGREVAVVWACNSRWLLAHTRSTESTLRAALVSNRQLSPDTTVDALPMFLNRWGATGDVVAALSHLRRQFGRGDERAAPVLWLRRPEERYWFDRTIDIEFPATVSTGLADNQCVLHEAQGAYHTGAHRAGLLSALQFEAKQIQGTTGITQPRSFLVPEPCASPLGGRRLVGKNLVSSRLVRAVLGGSPPEAVLDGPATVTCEEATRYARAVGGRLPRAAEYEFLAIGPQTPGTGMACVLPGKAAAEVGKVRDFPQHGGYPKIPLWAPVEEWVMHDQQPCLVGGRPSTGPAPRSIARCLPQVRAIPAPGMVAGFRVVWDE
ncbi:MAG: hypothetical protein IPK26_20420 [Planctomycetes bacterium]|nr:hypothetical protein [Planctomycetota bacterium]